MRKCLLLIFLAAVLRIEAAPNFTPEPRVSVRATQPMATEPAGTPGIFTVYRSGETNVPLTISYTLAGNASNGVDYASVPNSITLPAGQVSSNIVITPVAEPSAKGYKRVILTVENERGSYLDGALRRAVVYIVYNYTNTPPQVKMLAPTNGASYFSRPNISLIASATDSNGWVSSVQFFANGAAIGTVTNQDFVTGAVPVAIMRESRGLVMPLWPGARTARFEYLWTQVPPGDYQITAVATDNAGLQTTSSATSISISTNLPTPEVRIINPVDGAMYSASAPINIYAAAGETNGVITTVEFLAGTNEIGVATNYLATEPNSQYQLRARWLPYYFRWTNAPVGSNTITAVAIDNNGTTANSAPVTIDVTTNSHPHRW